MDGLDDRNTTAKHGDKTMIRGQMKQSIHSNVGAMRLPPPDYSKCGDRIRYNANVLTCRWGNSTAVACNLRAGDVRWMPDVVWDMLVSVAM